MLANSNNDIDSDIDIDDEESEKTSERRICVVLFVTTAESIVQIALTID